jgi:hypothetical protein
MGCAHFSARVPTTYSRPKDKQQGAVSAAIIRGLALLARFISSSNGETPMVIRSAPNRRGCAWEWTHRVIPKSPGQQSSVGRPVISEKGTRSTAQDALPERLFGADSRGPGRARRVPVGRATSSLGSRRSNAGWHRSSPRFSLQPEFRNRRRHYGIPRVVPCAFSWLCNSLPCRSRQIQEWAYRECPLGPFPHRRRPDT